MTKDFSEATTHPDKVRPSSAVSRWSMDSSDVSSGVISDSWSSNDGILNGGVTAGASGVGGSEAFSFDGSDDYVDVSSIDLTGFSEFTFSGWVYLPNGPDHNGCVFGSNYNSSDDLRIFTSDISFDDGTVNPIDPSSYISSETWVHLAVTQSNNTGSICLYINGVCVQETSGSSFDYQGLEGEEKIGRRSFKSTSPLDGKVDEVRIYSEALSQQQIWKLYNIGRNANWGLSRS